MKLRNVLVVYKKSSFQLYARERKDRQFLKLLRRNHSSIARFVRIHKQHREAIDLVSDVLQERNLRARFIYRARPFNEQKYDLVLTVGGDGTFLEASHRVSLCPMLGVNSSPTDSVGMFCGATASALHSILDEIESGTCPITEITRLNLRIGGKKVTTPVLNDLLIAHANPAATSRYILRWQGREEEHKSSGLWIAPPAGSTAAISGAGGGFLSIHSRSFQFQVRELYRVEGRRYRFERGVISPKGKLTVISKIRAGRIYLDGPHLSYHFPIGETVEITARAPRLHVYKFNEVRRRRLGA